eukprot:2604197-Prorocentrum_lima.AAC.1
MCIRDSAPPAGATGRGALRSPQPPRWKGPSLSPSLGVAPPHAASPAPCAPPGSPSLCGPSCGTGNTSDPGGSLPGGHS